MAQELGRAYAQAPHKRQGASLLELFHGNVDEGAQTRLQGLDDPHGVEEQREGAYIYRGCVCQVMQKE